MIRTNFEPNPEKFSWKTVKFTFKPKPSRSSKLLMRCQSYLRLIGYKIPSILCFGNWQQTREVYFTRHNPDVLHQLDSQRCPRYSIKTETEKKTEIIVETTLTTEEHQILRIHVLLAAAHQNITLAPQMWLQLDVIHRDCTFATISNVKMFSTKSVACSCCTVFRSLIHTQLCLVRPWLWPDMLLYPRSAHHTTIGWCVIVFFYFKSKRRLVDFKTLPSNFRQMTCQR